MLSPINANTTEVSSIINESITRKDEDDTLESLLNDKDTSEGIAETDEVVKQSNVEKKKIVFAGLGKSFKKDIFQKSLNASAYSKFKKELYFKPQNDDDLSLPQFLTKALKEINVFLDDNEWPRIKPVTEFTIRTIADFPNPIDWSINLKQLRIDKSRLKKFL